MKSAARSSAASDSPQSLLAGSALLVATGFVDIYTFLAHGHVFAEAMTGNLVLIGVGTFHPQTVEFWRPLAAFTAFVVGIASVWWLGRRTTSRARSRSHVHVPQLTTLAFEIVLLTVVAFLPTGFPSAVISTVIAFASGMQIAAFQHFGPTSFTTTVMTSNSLHAVDAILTALASRARRDIVVALRLTGALGCFVAGVLVGGFMTVHIGTRASLVAAALFSIAAAGYVIPLVQPAGEPVGSAPPP